MTDNPIREFEAVKAVIENGNRFLLTTHVGPDGDGVGSEVALYHYLKSIGKEPHIINCSPLPDNFNYLVSNNEIEHFNEDRSTNIFKEFDAAFVLDIGNYARLKEVGQLITYNEIPTVCIDHHPKEDDKFDHYFLDTSASATGELIFDLLEELGAEITLLMAKAIYSAVMSDTGSFRFNNTNEKSHRIAAQMIGIGVDPETIWASVYGEIPPERVSIQAEAMNKIQYAFDGKLAWCAVDKQMLGRAKARPRELEGFTDYLRNIKGVKASVVLIEISNDITKLSFRSKGDFDSNEFARRMGGGGHKYASGARVEKGYKEIIPEMLKEAEDIMSSTNNNS